MSITLVVLAAGIGSRYGGLKQMDPVGPSGEFILDYAAYDAKRAGFSRIVFVIRKDIEAAFKEVIGARVAAHIDVGYVRQDLADLPRGFSVPPGRSKPWGTAHAIRTCRDIVHEPFAAINADDFYGRDAYRVLARLLRDTADDPAAYGMVGFPLLNTLSEHGSVSRGICAIDARGYLRTVVERTSIYLTPQGVVCDEQPLHGDEIASMNMWAFKPSLFAYLEEEFQKFLTEQGQEATSEFFLPTVVDTLTTTGQVTTRVLETTAQWFGVTNPDDRPRVVAALRKLTDAGEYPEQLWA